MTVRVAATINFSTDGIFLPRSWWKTDFCHWMCGAVLTGGCYSPGRSSRKARRMKLCSFYSTHCVHSYHSFFVGAGEEGLEREVGYLALSRHCGRV